MPRSILHIAILAGLALAAPMIAATAHAHDGRGHGAHRHGPVIEFHGRGGPRGAHRGHRKRFKGVPPRMIVRKLRHRGAYDFSPVWRKRDTLRVEATNRRGMRKRYVFDAYTGQFLRARPLYWVGPRGHRSGFVIHGHW